MTINGFYLEARHGERGRVWQSAPWERFEARGVIATSIALAALTAAAAGGGAIAAGAIQAHAAGNAANTAVGAQRSAMEMQLQSEREARAASTAANDQQFAYLRGQSTLARADAETNRAGDYESWAAREGRLGTLGEALGMPARQIPAYRPLSADPSAGGGGAPADPKVAAFISKWQAEHSPTEGIAPLAAAIKAAGLGDRYMYGNTASNNELDIKGYGKYKVLAGENGSNPSWYAAGAYDGGGGAPAGSIRSMAPYQPLAPAVMASRAPVPGSIRAFA